MFPTPSAPATTFETCRAALRHAVDLVVAFATLRDAEPAPGAASARVSDVPGGRTDVPLGNGRRMRADSRASAAGGLPTRLAPHAVPQNETQ